MYVHPFSNMPVELLGAIYSYLDQKDQKTFSHIDTTILKKIHELIRSTRFFPPYSGSAAPDNILVSIIQRYPNAQKLTFGPKASLPSTGCEGFKEPESKLLRSMIDFLNTKPKLPFRKIELHEMETSAELQRSLIESLALPTLRSFVFRAPCNTSVLQSSDIQPILCKDVKLRKFKWVRDEYSMVRSKYSDKMAISLSFKEQIDLISAKFYHLYLHINTLQSLLRCPNLETLTLDACCLSNSEFLNLLKDHTWKFKHLEVPVITVLSDHELDTVTKQLPSLETLHISLKNVTEEGFIHMKKNCPRLRVIKLLYPTATDAELTHVATYFPDVEMLAFEARDITAKGIASLATCTKLRVLKIGNLKNLESLCLQTLSQALTQLEVLEINHIEILSLNKLPSLIESIPNLIYLQIRNGDNIKTQGHMTKMREKYPRLLEFPPTRKIHRFLS